MGFLCQAPSCQVAFYPNDRLGGKGQRQSSGVFSRAMRSSISAASTANVIRLSCRSSAETGVETGTQLY
jgi:hypothetical protein